MNAKDRKHYLDAWRYHIDALVDMYTTADADYEDFAAARNSLYDVMNAAADKAFPEPMMEATLPHTPKEAK